MQIPLKKQANLCKIHQTDVNNNNDNNTQKRQYVYHKVCYKADLLQVSFSLNKNNIKACKTIYTSTLLFTYYYVLLGSGGEALGKDLRMVRTQGPGFYSDFTLSYYSYTLFIEPLFSIMSYIERVKEGINVNWKY